MKLNSIVPEQIGKSCKQQLPWKCMLQGTVVSIVGTFEIKDWAKAG